MPSEPLPSPSPYAAIAHAQLHAPSKAALWTGRVLSFLPVPLMIMSAVMKFAKPQQVVEGMAHLGLPESLLVPLGVLELACVIVYCIPQTAVLGAILLTGYLGGVICTHLRVGEAVVVPALLGVVFWLGLFLRDVRLRALIPIRAKA